MTKGAFSWGGLKVEGSTQFSGMELNIEFQNENYAAFTFNPDGSKNFLTTVPDLISSVDEDTGEPISTEEVRNPNWQEADQLALYKRSRGVEPGTT